MRIYLEDGYCRDIAAFMVGGCFNLAYISPMRLSLSPSSDMDISIWCQRKLLHRRTGTDQIHKQIGICTSSRLPIESRTKSARHCKKIGFGSPCKQHEVQI
ncbi:hypothetical protein A3197_02555 [Candidatus Thiodiazotropha endoloripes]|nr:hypothetical protein A3197_02555 [Candidatus Thiodiazotropha endoloripes]